MSKPTVFEFMVVGFLIIMIITIVNFVMAGGDYCQMYRYASIKDAPVSCLKELTK